MHSRYDNLDGDNTKWELIQVRVSGRMKEDFKTTCILNETDMSELLRDFIRAWLATEREDPQPALKLDRFGWAMERVRKFFRPNIRYHYSRN